jgi:hypothetical protein
MRPLQCAIGLVFALMTSASFAKQPNAAAEAKALIGTEFVSQMMGVPISPGRSSCTDEGGGRLYVNGMNLDDWFEGVLSCQGRTIIILKKKLGHENGRPKWKIVDTLLLPPLTWEEGLGNRSSKLVLHLNADGQCDTRDTSPTSYFALLRWNKREQIDWRSGVEKAWTFDIEKERIVPRSTRDISCEWTEP